MRAETTTRQSVLIPDLFGKPLVAKFDEPHFSSDGGAILLKAADRRLGLIDRLAACVSDSRDPGKVKHEVGDLVAQRVFALACGYADGNDAGRIGDDPIFKLLLDRDAIEGDALASQPTLSRFENRVTRRDLFRMATALTDLVIERHRRRLSGKARQITIDLDPTDDLTHGGQQLALFNGFYGGHCYLPLLGFLKFDGESEQFAFAAMLRPGNAEAKRGVLGLLKRLLLKLDAAFPKARILVRLDGGFGGPEVLDFLEAAGCDYVVGMAENVKLKPMAQVALRIARRRSVRTGESEREYRTFWYAAGSWSKRRRVVLKAEVVRYPGREPRDNARYVVTSLKDDARSVYEDVYVARGDVENRIKELKLGLEIDRTSCTRFLANQFRVLLTLAAYILMQEIRLRAKRTRFARAQVWTMREALLKIGARVVVTVRRIVLHLPAGFAHASEWARLVGALGARAG